jgi:hypothetical protein
MQFHYGKFAWMIVPVLVVLISSYNKERRP